MKKMLSAPAAIPILVLLLLWLMPALLACTYDGSRCKDCILKQMKCGCPSCVPVLRCMAKCLWGGSSRANCIQRCNCGSNGNPKLSDCKKCMSKCKCSCMA
ncbi:uncharacterized protein LOC133795080 [Humulus lupulus]|uniref:uncharacterized protein LOC133795080 n=1 Tax=Humulus lupulus TaxID=3486 RepID=UPI002B401002|nr:uncharacterized protein LOC133795080 [Humulus lupulus]